MKNWEAVIECGWRKVLRLRLRQQSFSRLPHCNACLAMDTERCSLVRYFLVMLSDYDGEDVLEVTLSVSFECLSCIVKVRSLIVRIPQLVGEWAL